MGRPLTNSIDRFITYPILYHNIGHFKNIHPISITMACIFAKYISILFLASRYTYLLAVSLTFERVLDCLDGEVARYYHKCSKVGHYLDKYSDLLYRICMCYQTFKICIYANYYSISWILLLICSTLFPSLYIYDYSRGNISGDFINTNNSKSIILEDNATLICIMLPILVSFIH